MLRYGGLFAVHVPQLRAVLCRRAESRVLERTRQSVIRGHGGSWRMCEVISVAVDWNLVKQNRREQERLALWLCNQ